MIDLPQQFGKYTLVERIAIGGMAEIFKASAEGLGGFEKLLAIKRLHPRYSEDQDFIHMLVDEAKIAVQLSHSNLGQIFDLGREENLVFIAMEYIDGRDLYRLLKRLNDQGLPMPIEVAVYIVMEVCAGLDFAHRKLAPDGTPMCIIHRDISPQNVIVSWEGEVKLIDFGIAKATMRAFETESGVIKGKFYYMSPEQARGEKLDHRSDIFSLGVCLYELLTGHTVYREEDDVTLLSRVRRAEISPPTTMRPDIPLALERIVMKALARNPRRRYQSAHQLQLALTSFLYSLGQPYGRVQLGAYVRSVFDREQVHENIPISYHDRFMSRVDYNVDGSKLSSALIDEDEITAIVAERETLKPGLPPLGGRPPMGDPLAEGIISEPGEFESGPTAASSEPPGFPDEMGEDEVTWLYPGSVMIERETTGNRPTPPAFSGDLLDAVLASESGPASLAGAASGDMDDSAPSLDFDPGLHTGMVTGVYDEPTRITELDSQEIIIAARAGRPAPGRDQGRDLYSIPLSFKLLFAIGLGVILLSGGTISALSAVFIKPSLNLENVAVDEDPLPKGAPDRKTQAETTPKGQAAVDAQEGPDTRTLKVLVDGPQDAMVSLGEREPRPAPASFEKLVLGEDYKLEVTSPNHSKYSETLQVSEALPSAYSVVLKPRLGTITINTEPPGAKIEINSVVLTERTPHNKGELNRVRPVKVKLTLEGYETYEGEISWRDEDINVKTLDIRLAPLEKKEVPKNEVPAKTVDKPRDGRAKLAARERRDRRERIQRERRERERAARERAARDRVADRGGEEVGFGTLSVNAKPWGQVYVDGKKVANETPVTGLRLRAGYHNVRVVFPTLGNKARSKQVRITAGKPTPISFRP